MNTGLSLSPWNVDPADLPPGSSTEDRARFFLRFALLAPSSHNSQPWIFRIAGDGVELRSDPSRWLRVADSDGRELQLSLGCALENLLIAARRFGHAPHVEVLDGPTEGAAVRVVLGPSEREPTPRERALFEAIAQRRTSHQHFTERSLEDTLLEDLRRAADERGVEWVPIADGETRHTLADLQEEADALQMADEAYREELGEWIGSGALGDGWPKARIAQWVVTHFDLGKREGSNNASYLRAAPLVGVLVTEGDDRPARIRAGQAWERIALTATVAGVATHPLSQILEVPELKNRLSGLLGLAGRVPQHLFRAGYAADASEHTPRWPMERFTHG